MKVGDVIDPKGISKEDLYGVLDPSTREWTDGLLVWSRLFVARKVFRATSRATKRRDQTNGLLTHTLRK